MAEARHGRLTTSEGIHIGYQWSYADATARTGATGFEAHHVGKLARQEDNDTIWMLTATTPTWSKVGGPDSAITLSDHDHSGDAGDGGTIDHGALTGRGDDDHDQYVLADGTRAGASSQAQDFGANGIAADVIAESTADTGVTVDGLLLKDGNVDGIDASAHATRHDAGGADALSTVPDHDHSGDAGDGAQIGVGALSSKTGSDTSVVTGTAGGDGDAVIWNADGDAVEGAPLGTSPEGDFDDLASRLDAGEMTFVNVMDADAGECVILPPWSYGGIDYPAVMVQKYLASQPNATARNRNPDIADGASVAAVKPVSQAGVSPWVEITQHRARKACANLGDGWTLMTADVWGRIAYQQLANGTLARGPNANTDPPSDADEPTETGLLDYALYADNADKSSLPGYDPVTWLSNWRADGISGTNGRRWNWLSGCYAIPVSTSDDSDTPVAITGAGSAGVLIHANRTLTLTEAPLGESTSVAANTLTDSNKEWTVDDFIGCWLFDAAGNVYAITDSDATSVTIDCAGSPTAGPYEILRLVETDLTSGMTNGHRVLTLRDDADLGPLAIPATADGTGSAVYGNDGFYHNVTELRAARRGGAWPDGAGAGVFALNLTRAPSSRDDGLGFRACKAL